MVLFAASLRFCCPVITLLQVGGTIASKSAMKVFAQIEGIEPFSIN
jgi:hypothetical protein